MWRELVGRIFGGELSSRGRASDSIKAGVGSRPLPWGLGAPGRWLRAPAHAPPRSPAGRVPLPPKLPATRLDAHKGLGVL